MRELRREIVRDIKGGAYREGEEKCREFLEYEPEDTKVRIFRAYCLCEMGELSESMGLYRQIKSLSEEGSEQYLEALQGMGRAVERMCATEKRPKESAEILEELIKVYVERGREEKILPQLKLLLEIYEEEGEVEKYMEEACKVVAMKIGRGGVIEVPDAYRVHILQTMFCMLSRRYRREMNVLVETGVFAEKRPVLVEKVREVQERHRELVPLLAEIERCVERKGSKMDPEISGYMEYLVNEMYVSPKKRKWRRVLEKVELYGARVDKRMLILFRAAVSDFVDVPGLLGSAAEYKGIMYNTLSPTVLFLKRGRCALAARECLGIYSEMEKEMGEEYSLKKEYFSFHAYMEAMANRMEQSREYTQTEIPGKAQVSYEDLVEVNLPGCISKFISRAMSFSAFSFALSLYGVFLSKRKHWEGKVSLLKERVRSLADSPGVCWVPGIVDMVREFEENEFVSAVQIDLSYVHCVIQMNRAHLGSLQLIQVGERLEGVKKDFPRHNTSEDLESGGEVWRYARVLSILLARIVEKGAGGAQREVPSPGQWQLGYGDDSLAGKYDRRLEGVSENVRGVARDVNPDGHVYMQWLAAMDYHKAGRTDKAILLLQELYRKRPRDILLVGDLGKLLNSSGNRREALAEMEEYLRGKVCMGEEPLYLMSLQLFREEGDWQKVELRCKELLKWRYCYETKILLCDALEKQNKLLYCKEMVTEMLEHERSVYAEGGPSDRFFSALLYRVRLMIKMREFSETEEEIARIFSSEIEIPQGHMEQLNYYKKYAKAASVKDLMHRGGITELKKTLDAYWQVGSSGALSEEIDLYISLVDRALKRKRPLNKREYSSGDPMLSSYWTTRARALMAVHMTEGGMGKEAAEEVLQNIRKAREIQVTKEALELEFVVRAMNGEEDAHKVYGEERGIEMTRISRIIHAVLYDRNKILPSAQIYLSAPTLLEKELLLFVVRTLRENEVAGKRSLLRDDMEKILLHLCRVSREPTEEMKEIAHLLGLGL
jgi:tetratricopeptide (TPR) repeat protein